MRLAFIVFARDKALYVRRAVRAALAQTLSPLTIYLSDHGSTDGTREILHEEARAYNGPNKVVLLDCPLTEKRGMAGAVAHVRWLQHQVEADFWLWQAADDYSFPERAKKTLTAIEGLHKLPLHLSTARFYATQEQVESGDFSRARRTRYPLKNQWVAPEEQLYHKIGGSSSCAYGPELAELAGTPDIVDLDTWLTFIAAMHGRYYFLASLLDCYVVTPDGGNAELETRMKLAEDEATALRFAEHAWFWSASTAYEIACAAEKHMNATGDRAIYSLAMRYLLEESTKLIDARRKLTLRNIAPSPGTSVF